MDDLHDRVTSGVKSAHCGNKNKYEHTCMCRHEKDVVKGNRWLTFPWLRFMWETYRSRSGNHWRHSPQVQPVGFTRVLRSRSVFFLGPSARLTRPVCCWVDWASCCRLLLSVPFLFFSSSGLTSPPCTLYNKQPVNPLPFSATDFCCQYGSTVPSRIMARIALCLSVVCFKTMRNIVQRCRGFNLTQRRDRNSFKAVFCPQGIVSWNPHKPSEHAVVHTPGL